MTIEVTSTSICSGIVRIYGIDCSEENLQRMERIRDDGTEREVVFVFDTKNDQKYFEYLSCWLHRQKITKESATYGEALKKIIGIITTISGKYLELM